MAMTRSAGLGGKPHRKLSLFLPLLFLILPFLPDYVPPSFSFRLLLLLLSGLLLSLFLPLIFIFILVLIKVEALTCFEKCTSWKLFFNAGKGLISVMPQFTAPSIFKIGLWLSCRARPS